MFVTKTLALSTPDSVAQKKFLASQSDSSFGGRFALGEDIVVCENIMLLQIWTNLGRVAFCGLPRVGGTQCDFEKETKHCASNGAIWVHPRPPHLFGRLIDGRRRLRPK
jgi:hypothetical protein